MEGELRARAVRGRDAKQERSERTRGAIVEAALTLLAETGVAGLTHRRVAARSGVSLAATTYYFASKEDMLAAAANEALRTYTSTFPDVLEAWRGQGPAAFRALVAQVLGWAVGDNRLGTLAWWEILLDGARRPEAREPARLWFERLGRLWQQGARDAGFPDPGATGLASMDFVHGALLYGLALGFDRAAAEGMVFGRASEPVQAAAPEAPPADAPPTSGRGGATRERILDAAIHLLASEGAAAVSYRSVAAAAGLTPRAPAYHFASLEHLMAEAQALLVERSNARIRASLAGLGERIDVATAAESMAAVFRRETTVFCELNLATFAVMLEAARNPRLRPQIGAATDGLHHAARGVDAQLGGSGGTAGPRLIELLTIGALVRTLACGATEAEFAAHRARLQGELAATIEGRHWIQVAQGAPPRTTVG